MTDKCPHCGAAQADKREYTCGTRTYCNIRGEYCYEQEIERLEALIADPPCKPLEFRPRGSSGFVADGVLGPIWVDSDITSWAVGGSLPIPHKPVQLDTAEIAKAHAESLHQQAWRELNQKWGMR